MWNRQNVKSKGKERFKANYWRAVLVAFIYSLFFISSGTTVKLNDEELEATFGEFMQDPDAGLIMLALLGILGAVMFIVTLVDVFVLNPLEVGCNRFFLVNQKDSAELGELGYAYSNHYVVTVAAIFLRNLLIVIGCVLFIIPGIILSYSYRMVPYILAEEKGISAVDALKKSRAMMNGHKWNCFVYDLSFIGWYLLSVITVGLVGFFYYRPYKLSADAALYEAIRG